MRLVAMLVALICGAVALEGVAAGQEAEEDVNNVANGFRVGSGHELTADVWSITAPASEPSSGDGSSGGSPTTCSVYGLPPGVLVASRAVRDQLAPAAGEMVAEEWYYLECRRNDDGNVVYADRWQYLPGTPEPGPDLAALARQAYDNVPLVAPRPGTSPPAGGEQLVGFPTWLWIDPAGWQVLSAEATIPGFGVTVTATPRDVTWDMGNGEEVVCAGPGRAWVEGMDDADEPGGTDCSYVYQYSSVDEPGGRYAASVTTTWSVAWQASTGEAGTLADASRTTAVPLTVAQRQAVIHYGAG